MLHFRADSPCCEQSIAGIVHAVDELEIEPAIGWQWTIWFQWDGEEIEPMIAMALTAEKALEEARYSLSFHGEDYTIFGLMRDDKIAP